MKATEFLFQSPQWGSNSKDLQDALFSDLWGFQSPQWGSNSKELNKVFITS